MHSPTGVNIRQILTETGVRIIPGLNNKCELKNHRVYNMPEEQKWRVALIKGIVEIREKRWEVLFDIENSSLNNDDFQAIIYDVCSSR